MPRLSPGSRGVITETDTPIVSEIPVRAYSGSTPSLRSLVDRTTNAVLGNRVREASIPSSRSIGSRSLSPAPQGYAGAGGTINSVPQTSVYSSANGDFARLADLYSAFIGSQTNYALPRDTSDQGATIVIPPVVEAGGGSNYSGLLILLLIGGAIVGGIYFARKRGWF